MDVDVGCCASKTYRYVSVKNSLSVRCVYTFISIVIAIKKKRMLLDTEALHPIILQVLTGLGCQNQYPCNVNRPYELQYEGIP